MTVKIEANPNYGIGHCKKRCWVENEGCTLIYMGTKQGLMKTEQEKLLSQFVIQNVNNLLGSKNKPTDHYNHSQQ